MRVWRRSLASDIVALKHPGLRSRRTEALSEAAGLAFSRRHKSPTETKLLQDGTKGTLTLEWESPNEGAHLSWDPRVATEWAAELVGIVAFEAVNELVVVRKAVCGEYTDFYFGKEGEDFEDAAVLEISGTDKGNIKSRLSEKIEQVSKNTDKLPAFAAVVRFKEPIVHIKEVKKDGEK